MKNVKQIKQEIKDQVASRVNQAKDKIVNFKVSEKTKQRVTKVAIVAAVVATKALFDYVTTPELQENTSGDIMRFRPNRMSSWEYKFM